MKNFAQFVKENEEPQHLYKWVNGKQFQKYLDKGHLPVKKKYAHHIGGKFVRGNSFTDEQNLHRWKANHDTLVRVDRHKLTNPVHHIPGHKTYLKTMGMTSSLHDPHSWEYESDHKDEHWVEGPVNFRSANASIVPHHEVQQLLTKNSRH